MELTAIFLWVLALALVVIGMAGIILPVLPGPSLIFIGLVMAAWAEGFSHVGPITIGILAVLAVLASAVDFLAGAYGVKRFGASRRAMIGAAVGAVIGIFFNIPGILIGPFAGAVIGELTVKHDIHMAGRAGFGAWLGLIMGIAAKVALGFIMIGVFVIARFF
jgi:uncharacterized protein YqgC (DUF456 family)